MKIKLALIIICVNCLVCLTAGVVVHSAATLAGLVREKSAESGKKSGDSADSGKDVVNIDLKKETLMNREKTFAAAKSIKESYSKVKTGNPQIYTSLPEREFYQSLFNFIFFSQVLSKQEVV